MESHQAVLTKELISYLNCKKGGIYIDGTLGRGGHTESILKKIKDQGKVIAIDRDQAAIEASKKRLKRYKSLKIVQGNYIEIPKILDCLKIANVDGMIFDLGVSSPQLDDPLRGFSYQENGPLDMRMDQTQKVTAKEIVNTYSLSQLTKIIKEYGEERWAARIAKFIVDYRQREKIATTFDLVEIIKAAIPAAARRSGGHPARRTFQALRIATNDELSQLKQLINKVVTRLKTGGRLCIISFHSLEDRIVKTSFKQLAKKCVCPPDFPICVCEKEVKLKIITKKPVMAQATEIANNRRARSAKLRVAEKF